MLKKGHLTTLLFETKSFMAIVMHLHDVSEDTTCKTNCKQTTLMLHTANIGGGGHIGGAAGHVGCKGGSPRTMAGAMPKS